MRYLVRGVGDLLMRVTEVVRVLRRAEERVDLALAAPERGCRIGSPAVTEGGVSRGTDGCNGEKDPQLVLAGVGLDDLVVVT